VHLDTWSVAGQHWTAPSRTRSGQPACNIDRNFHMKLSARNQIAGTIKTVKPGATTTHVTIEVSPSVTITASITNEAAEELQLTVGMAATAVIKASDVMVGV
jgi:molybdopterin-binding protein